MKVNAEDGEGIALNNRYDIRGYPTFLYVNGKGEVVSRKEGYTEPDDLIRFGTDAMARAREGI